MPQLDKITFLSQFFWLSFFYLGFYFLIYKYFLPKMSRTLKFRKRRINTSQEGVITMGEENDKVASSYQTVLSTGLYTCKNVLHQNFKSAEDWLNNTVSQANQTRLKNINTIYIYSLGERSISQGLVIKRAFADLSEKSRFALLISKLSSLKKENNSTLAQNIQSQKGNKLEKTQNKSNIVEKQETLQTSPRSSSGDLSVKDVSSSKNKDRQNKDIEQTSGKGVKSQSEDNKVKDASVPKDLSSKEKNPKTVSPKSPTNKNKNSKKK